MPSMFGSLLIIQFLMTTQQIMLDKIKRLNYDFKSLYLLNVSSLKQCNKISVLYNRTPIM